MLMAAGLGTRMRPFTELEPKALLPVMGVPCAQFAIDAAVNAGVQKIVANVHHLASGARAGLQNLELGSASLQISDESGLLLGSAGGIAKALPHFSGEPFFLLNADVLCDVDLSELARAHQRLRDQRGITLTLTIFEKPEGSGAYREILLDSATGLIRGLGEITQGKPYFVGVAILEPEALRGVDGNRPSEFVPMILEPAIRAGKVGYFLTRGKWFDIGSAELWCESHFELMRLLETGDLSQGWRRRIESVSRRVGQGMWTGRSSKKVLSTADWQAECYFQDLGDSTAQAPRELGPKAVVYGQAPSYAGRIESGISFRGLTKKI